MAVPSNDRLPWCRVCACGLLLLLLPWLSVRALGAQEGDFQFEIVSAGVRITGYSGPGGSVVIPDHVFGLPVRTIAPNAFYVQTSLTNVTIPDSVTSIGYSAFSGCTSLTSIVIPHSVTSIGYSAFSRCRSLTSIVIPDSVTLVEFEMFSDCISLTSVVIPNSVTSIGSGAFNGCTSLTGVAIPNSVTSIEPYVFWNCITLTNVMIPNSVTSRIGEHAFSGCTGLTSVMIPNGVTSIDSFAFNGCTGLTNVTIGNSVTSIVAAFSGCTNLTSVYFEGNAPSIIGFPGGPGVFDGSLSVTVFFRAGATGWDSTLAGRPTAVWELRPSYSEWVVSSGLTAQFPNASAEGDDPDGDGLSNHNEWLAGTDPTQRASVLALELVPRPADLAGTDQTPVPGGYRAVYFRSVPGRYYGVQSTALISGPWALQDVRVASATQTRFVVQNPQGSAFYRVVLDP